MKFAPGRLIKYELFIDSTVTGHGKELIFLFIYADNRKLAI